METIFIAFLFSFIAGISTGLGGLIAFLVKEFKYTQLSIFMGFSVGVMVYISFVELLFTAVRDIGLICANVAFFLGIIIIATLDFLIPHEYKDEHIPKGEKERRKIARTGLLISIGIAIHNFPEGFVAFFGTIKDVHLGFLLLLAVALHNIPEGISVSVPIYYATKDRKKAFKWSLLSGIAEPVGAIIGFLILYPFLSSFLVNMVLASTAGMMIFISFDELLPFSLKYGEEHNVIVSLFLGMALMLLTLILIR